MAWHHQRCNVDDDDDDDQDDQDDVDVHFIPFYTGGGRAGREQGASKCQSKQKRAR